MLIIHYNVPIAAPAFLITLFVLPREFPYHGRPNYRKRTMRDLVAKSTLERVDIPGTLLILFAALSLTAAFEEAGSLFPWRSAYVITMIVTPGILWIALMVWERHVTISNRVREPILPWNFLTNRQMMGILL